MNKKKARAGLAQLRALVSSGWIRIKTRELWKDALIGALVISAVLLSTRSGLIERRGREAAHTVESAASQGEYINDSSVGLTVAARPYCIAVTPGQGSHYAALYDGDTLDSLYSQFSAALGEALGSSGEPETATEEEWRAALRGVGVYFDFSADQPLSVVAGWLGTTMPGGASNHTARRICLAGEGGEVVLYYIRAREGEGAAYRCSTALHWSALSALAEEYMPNGAQYNFELESPFESVDPYALLLPDQPELKTVTAKTPQRTAEENEKLLNALGMNSYLAAVYTETDGTEVWIEGDDTLRIDSNGVASFTGGGALSGASPLSAAEMIEYVRFMLEDTIGQKCGAAELQLSYIAYDSETEEYALRFEYRIGALSVSLGAGRSAAMVTIRGREISQAVLVYREYTESEETERPLPPIQAAAVVSSSGGGEPVLSYLDDFTAVRGAWVIR